MTATARQFAQLAPQDLHMQATPGAVLPRRGAATVAGAETRPASLCVELHLEQLQLLVPMLQLACQAPGVVQESTDARRYTITISDAEGQPWKRHWNGASDSSAL